ncbi:MAG: hypothetical protein QS98_C0010G0048 [archaeon GW2011_AR3]|nr:MAG: hypothetical protein QS98_C0010G0048 [archaeon GW2011_AR3]
MTEETPEEKRKRLEAILEKAGLKGIVKIKNKEEHIEC